MKQKHLAFLLTAFSSLFLLTACGSQDQKQATTNLLHIKSEIVSGQYRKANTQLKKYLEKHENDKEAKAIKHHLHLYTKACSLYTTKHYKEAEKYAQKAIKTKTLPEIQERAKDLKQTIQKEAKAQNKKVKTTNSTDKKQANTTATQVKNTK